MIRQFYYTSCKNGLGTSSGYQFNAATPGVDQDVLASAQGVVSYEAPPSAPLQPTPAEIAHFPVALSYNMLDEDSALLCRSVYVGADFSGRSGNFFAHGLHLDALPLELSGRHPIDLWESPLWVTQEAVSTELPHIPSLPRTGAFTVAELDEFLDRDGRRTQLPSFLAALKHALDPSGRQLVIIERTSDDVARWVAVASRSLPHRLTLQLTFTTYTRRPYYASQRIIGTTEDSDFQLTGADSSGPYLVFDFVRRQFSPLDGDEWSSLTATMWEPGSRALEQFYDFLDSIGLAERRTDLGAALAAFTIAHGRELGGRGAARAIRWVDSHGDRLSDEFWRAFCRHLPARTGDMSLAELGAVSQAWLSGPRAELAGPLVKQYIDEVVRHIAAGSEVGDAWLPDRPIAGVDVDVDDVLASAVRNGRPFSVIAALLQLFADLGQRVDARLLESVGGQRVAVDLLDGRAAPQAFLDLVRDPDLDALAAGVLGRFDAVAAGKADDPALAALLDGPMGVWLASRDLTPCEALERARVVHIAARHPDRRVECLNEMLGEPELDDDGGGFGTAPSAVSGAELNKAIDLLWGSEPVSQRDGQRLLQVVPIEALREGRRTAWLMQAVTDAEELTMDVVALAAQLDIYGEELGLRSDERELLRMILSANGARAHGRGHTPATVHADLLDASRLERFDAPIVDALLNDYARLLLGMEPERHAEALTRAIARSQTQLIRRYRSLAAELPAPTGHEWDDAVARRFVAWCMIARDVPSASEELLNDVLAPAVHEAAPERIVKVQDVLGYFHPAYRPRWDQWLAEITKRRPFSRRRRRAPKTS